MFLFIFIVQIEAEAASAEPLVTETLDSLSAKGKLFLKGHAERVDGVSGKLLRLPSRSYAELSLSRGLSARAGTLTFWIRPLWKSSDPSSHVFLTSRWQDGSNGYLAISYGWWEPVGQDRIYFIVNNEEEFHCSERYKFQPQIWTHISVSWEKGSKGNCRIFIDGSKIAEYRGPFQGNYESSGKIYLGSEMGATDQRNRLSDFEFENLEIYDSAMSDSRIVSRDKETYFKRMKKPLIGGEWIKSELKNQTPSLQNKDRTLRETRAIFDEDIHWAYSPEASNHILEKVKSAGFNVYVPCVWHGGGTYFPTDQAAPDQRLAELLSGGYDPLAYLIKKAHELKIEVHPWFTVVRRDWNQYPEFFVEGTPDHAYDVHNSFFRTFIVNLMLDVVKRYDIDGINLDYIRAMGICVSEKCQEDYRRTVGRKLTEDLDRLSGYSNSRMSIEMWQDRAVEKIVEDFSIAARRLKPRLVISVDGHPPPPGRVRPLEGRDELRWLDRGRIDIIFDMDYRSQIDYVSIDRIQAKLDKPGRFIPLLANFDWLDGKPVSRSGGMIERLIKLSRAKWPESGIGFYIYSAMTDDQIGALKATVFAEEARPFWKHGRSPW